MAASSVFEMGKLEVHVKSVNQSDSSSPPKSFLISYPTQKGDYGVVLFLHGFLISNSFYKELISHISSHGYIVVAPGIIYPRLQDEINSAAQVANWLPEGLQAALPPNVRPNLSKLTLAGHSRGGKAAFCMLLGLAGSPLTVQFSGLIGVDPVAGFQIPGTNYKMEIPPKIITNNSKPFDINVPTLIIGTELGEEAKGCLTPPCAPAGLNYEQFYEKSKEPSYLFVARGYGHMDVLDDISKNDIMGKLTYCVCKNGKEREPMRRTAGGLMVAFLKAFSDGQRDDLDAILNDPELAPIQLDVEAKLSSRINSSIIVVL